VSGVKDFSYEILDGAVVKEKGSAKGDFALKTAGYEFWSPENPKRYELKITTPEGVYTQKFGIRSIPAIFFIKGGKVVDQQIGACEKSVLKAKIDKLLK
jgi:hypothetical protein